MWVQSLGQEDLLEKEMATHSSILTWKIPWIEDPWQGSQKSQTLLLLSRFSRVQLCATPQTAAHQAPRPWDSPGKNTGVGCHFLLQCMKGKRESEVAQSCLTLSDPMDQAPPAMGFSRQEYWSGVPIPGATESEFLPQPPFF